SQEILRRYLKTDLNSFLFSPAESERQRRESLRIARVTPLTPSQRARDEARRRHPVALGNCYTVQAYRTAIQRACAAAGVPTWSPNQLRHAKATELRRLAGLDAAAAVLGHTKIETTQIYAERDMEVARRLARETA